MGTRELDWFAIHRDETGTFPHETLADGGLLHNKADI